MGRFERIVFGHAKKTSHSHLNGLQVTAVMIEILADFVDSLSVDLGYPCSHRRMKKYLTDPNLKTWGDLHGQYSSYITDVV